VCVCVCVAMLVCFAVLGTKLRLSHAREVLYH
jgi:hypothetical protein